MPSPSESKGIERFLEEETPMASFYWHTKAVKESFGGIRKRGNTLRLSLTKYCLILSDLMSLLTDRPACISHLSRIKTPKDHGHDVLHRHERRSSRLAYLWSDNSQKGDQGWAQRDRLTDKVFLSDQSYRYSQLHLSYGVNVSLSGCRRT